MPQDPEDVAPETLTDRALAADQSIVDEATATADAGAETVPGDHDLTAAGLHSVQDPDPAAAAARLAGQFGLVLVEGADGIDEALEALGEPAGQGVPDGEPAIGAAEATTRLAELEQPRPVTTGDVDHLRDLLGQLEQAERIRDRTEERFPDSLARRLASTSTVAVHPDALRAAARAVHDARLDVEAARVALERQVAASTPQPDDREPVADADQAPDRGAADRAARTRTMRQAIGAVVAATGAALIVGALGIAPWFLVVLLPAAAIAWAFVALRSTREDREDREIASSYLASVDAATDQIFGDRTPPPLEVPEAVLRLRSRVDACAERLRAAEAAWHNLAGPDADPDDVEGVVRRNDPQVDLSPGWAAGAPTLRAVDTIARRARARWRVAWALVDRPEPEPEVRQAAVQALTTEAVPGPPSSELPPLEVVTERQQLRRVVSDARATASLDHAATPNEGGSQPDQRARGLVVVSPFTGMGKSRRRALRHRLREAAATRPIIVVTRPPSSPSPTS
jgi:hypothetical protein